MRGQRQKLLHCLAGAGVLGIATAAPLHAGAICEPQETAKITAAAPGAGDWFGYAVAIAGDIAAVGAWRDDTPAGADAGSVRLFAWIGGNWVPGTVVTAFDGAAGDRFGQNVAILGDRLIVGAPSDDNEAGADAGAAYVYRLVLSPEDMSYMADFETKLIGSDTAAGDLFGVSISMSENRAIVGALLHDHSGKTNAGAAYVFTRSGVTWTQQAKLTHPDPENEDHFGLSVALGSDAALVSAMERDVEGFSDAGAVYAYRRSGSSWPFKQQLTACDPFQFNNFGTWVALSGNTAVIGAHNSQTPGPSGRGAAYVFTDCVASWRQEAKLLAPDGELSDNFGICVAVEGDRALVGAFRNTHAGGSSAGAAYLFSRINNNWLLESKLTASDASASDGFGVSVALSNQRAVIGAWQDDLPGAGDAGSAYMIDLPGICDSDGDGILDFVDVCPDNEPGLPVAPNGRPLRDCNGDCLYDAADIQCLVDEMLNQ